MPQFIRLLLFIPIAVFLSSLTPSVFAQGPGPAGIPLIEYMLARVVCVTVPLGYTALLVVLVIAGFKYLTSGGEAKAVASAHQTVTWGLLGVLFLAIAWLILLLIQNFTGVEVTKFSVASLPGVQGFTGSCWTPAPETPTPVADTPSTPRATSLNLNVTQPTNKKNGFVEGRFDSMTLACGGGGNISRDGYHFNYGVCDPYGFACNNSSELFTPIRSDQYNLLSYRTPVGISELVNVYNSPVPIFSSAGSVDNVLYAGTQELLSVLPLFLQSVGLTGPYPKSSYLNVNNWTVRDTIDAGVVFARYERRDNDNIPVDLINAQIEARLVAIQLNPNWEQETGGGGAGFHLARIRCPDGDYFAAGVDSPIIYFYSKKNLVISAKVRGDLISPSVERNSNGYWNIVASPNGTLTTLDGKKYRYIPYEFLRSDFKRPDKGSVIEGSKLEEYLKNDLWKKLGLTDSEINDYWQDTKPRVRPAPHYFVSLIARSEIDRVLPMEVNPKPDTIIRNMTYILPLSQSPSMSIIPLEEEKLIAPEREGFTVLENGVFTD